MKVAHPWLAIVVYLGIGFLVLNEGLHDAADVMLCLVCGLLLYSFLGSLLTPR